MLKCRDISEQASDYIDHDLSAWMKLQYRLHLMMCKHCRLFIKNFSAGVEMVKKLPRETVAKERVDEIERRVKDTTGTQQQISDR